MKSTARPGIESLEAQMEPSQGLGLAPRSLAAIRERHTERPPVSEKLVSLVAPDSFAADQYRALRHTMERLKKESGFQMLAVTSPSPGDGKTVTTLNLAGALAQSPDARILVV